ncbi:MAG: glycosyl hydrolase family 8, partial [Candidatus Levyibacteriota bacterium]
MISISTLYNRIKHLSAIKLLATGLLFGLFFSNVLPLLSVTDAASTPSIQLSAASSSTESISLTFPQAVPAGNIIDVEVYNGSQKVWQDSNTGGGTSYKNTTGSLPNGSYTVSVGLFTSNWGSNYAWFDKIGSFTLPSASSTPAPTVTPASSPAPTGNLAVSVTPASSNTESISVTFPQLVPSGNIIDVEVYNGSQKVWQDSNTNGGTAYKNTTGALPNGTYTVNVGLFAPNWASNYAWHSNAATFILPNSSITQTPTQTPATNSPSAVVSPAGANAEKITVNLPQPVSNGNIIDIEVYNGSQKVWQDFTAAGGSTFSTTPNLPNGTYSVSVGVFTANWASTTVWYSNFATFSLPSGDSSSGTTGTSTPVSGAPINASVSSQAISAYNSWKGAYVVSAGSGKLRVARPENNNDTVSEGIGYGMLSAFMAGDQTTFDGLWNYAKQYLNGHGLMNWQIDRNGGVIGANGATDADEDIAYALMRGSAQWPGHGYDTAARAMIDSILTYEVENNNYVNPGDGWGNTTIINPSYLAPSYYRAFAAFTGNSRWNDVANQNSNWLLKAANSSTGLLPDWLNQDFSPANVSFDSYKNDFYYDASRVPVRLLIAARNNNDANAQTILTRQA